MYRKPSEQIRTELDVYNCSNKTAEFKSRQAQLVNITDSCETTKYYNAIYIRSKRDTGRPRTVDVPVIKWNEKK